jgi:diguanylate cyclase (GGDEF)-like protein
VSRSRAHETAMTEREEGRQTRADATSARAEIAGERDERAAHRDEIAHRRDETAKERDRAADRADQEAEQLARDLEDGDPRAKKALEAARRARKRAAIARTKAAEDRERAERDREAASRDRELLQAELQRANLDELTGGYRRGMGEVLLRHEMKRARRAKGKMTLLFIDIDNLKETNDRMGHDAGDRVLREVISAIRARLRSYDPIVRWGGDEFVCAVSGTSPEEAHRRVAEAQLDLARLDPSVSFGVGLATLEDGDTLGALIARADASLLEARGEER